MKRCSRCKRDKSLSEFYRDSKSKSGLASRCKACSSELSKIYHSKNPDYNKIRWERQEVREAEKDSRLRRRYNLTTAEFDAMLVMQDGKCAVCKTKPAIVVDHCHKTLEVRGLLCRECNRGIGLLQDSPTIIENALKYLAPLA